MLAWLDSIVYQLSAGTLPHAGSIFGCSTSTSLHLVDDNSAYEPTVFNIVEKRLSWKTARLVGELKQNTAYSDRSSTVARLASSREIFGSQQREYGHRALRYVRMSSVSGYLFDRVRGGVGNQAD